MFNFMPLSFIKPIFELIEFSFPLKVLHVLLFTAYAGQFQPMNDVSTDVAHILD